MQLKLHKQLNTGKVFLELIYVRTTGIIRKKVESPFRKIHKLILLEMNNDTVDLPCRHFWYTFTVL